MDEKIERSRAQEQHLADLLGGTRNSGSGNGWKRKSDVRTPGILWECKRTDGKSITIKDADLTAHRNYAYAEDRVPGFHIEIGGRRYMMFEEPEAVERMSLAQP